MEACVVIPARFASTRFPGKPLVPLLGKPMVLWVAELAARAVGQDHVYVATEDQRISKFVIEAGFKALMTSGHALTGTDRIAEAASMINYDIYVNVQGDEPLVSPEDILKCIEVKESNPGDIVNGFCWMDVTEDPENVNVPKVITNEAGIMIYMSRRSLPGYKEQRHAPHRYKKQVCIYGFSAAELKAYANFNRKSELESHEDIEILRFLELGRRVRMFEAKPGSLAVDVPQDVELVERVLEARLHKM